MSKEKIKVFELDFGDQNFITENFEDIVGWIESDLQDPDCDITEYTISIKYMTRKEIDDLPEWGN